MGVKRVIATPMTRIEYNEKRGWELPEEEKGMDHDEGYMVEYLDGGKANTDFSEHYVSWSPKEVFENAYKSEGEGLSFGDAIEMLKRGKLVARKGWNGRGMFIFMLSGGKVPTKAIHDPALAKVVEKATGGKTFDALPTIRMKTADNAILTGWLASQSDIFANDWEVIQP